MSREKPSRHRKPIGAKIFEEWNIDETVSFALHCIFRDNRYIPIDPYKTFLHITRRYERQKDLPRRVAYLDIPAVGQVPRVLRHLSMVRFRKSKVCCLDHHAKLLSNTDIKQLELTMGVVRASLGNLPSVVNKNDIKACFAEAILLSPGVGNTLLCTPHPHSLNIAVEAVLYGPRLDDCLMTFIRRVFEEVDSAKKCRNMVSSDCKVTAKSGTQTVFAMGDIRTQKQLVLTTIKTAVMDGGELSLDLFLRVSRHLPPSLCSPQHLHLWSQERTTGFIRIKKVYRFSHVDTSADQDGGSDSTAPPGGLDQRPVMCFSPIALDTLVRGIFFSSSDLELVMSVCLRHSASVEARKEAKEMAGRKYRKKKKSNALVNEDEVICIVMQHYCKIALRFFDNGEFVRAAAWLLLLQAFMTSSHNAGDIDETIDDGVNMTIRELSTQGDELVTLPSYCMLQLSSLTARVSGRLQSAVDSVEVVIDCVGLIVQTITSVTSGKYKSNEEALQDNAVSIYYKYDAIGGFLVELREILQCLHRDVPVIHCSDAALMMTVVLSDLATLFHSRQLNRPLLPPSDVLRIARSVGEKDDATGILQDMSRALKALDEPLRRILSGMTLLCSSVAGDTLLEIIQMDTDCRHRYKTPYSKRSIREMAHGILKDEPNISWASLETGPKTFSELLEKGREGIDQCGGWKPYKPRAIAKHVMDRNVNSFGAMDKEEAPLTSLNLGTLAVRENLLMSEVCAMTPYDVTAENRRTEVITRILDSGWVKSKDIPDTIEVLCGLALDWPGRSGVVNVRVCLEDELKFRHEVPACVALEAVKMRYMVETLANRSLLAVYTDLLMSSSCSNPFVKISKAFHRYSMLIHLWRTGDMQMLQNILFCINNTPTTSPRAPMKSLVTGAHLVSLGRISTILKGGLVGGRGILRYIFTNWKILFGNMWAIPPFLARAPASMGSGISTTMYCGASIETALRWGILPETSVFPPQKVPPPPPPPPQPFGLLVRGKIEEHLQDNQKIDQTFSDEEDEEEKDKRRKDKTEDVEYNEDIWSLSYPGQVNLEVVIKAEHEVPASVGRIRDMFAEEVVACLQYLMHSPEWVGNSVRVPVSSTASPTDTKAFTFSVQRLLTEEAYAVAFKRKVSKVGLAFVEGAATMVDESGNLAGGDNGGMVDFTSLLKLLRGLHVKGSGGGSRQQGGTKEGANEGEEDSGEGGSEEGTDEEYLHGQTDEDPTSQDVHRIASFGIASDQIRRGLRMKPRVYVPVHLRFSLLASIRGMDIPSAAAEKASGSFIPLLHFEKRHLTIGKSETMARLLASTVWLSPDAERGVWGCALKEESVRRCFYHEANRLSEHSKACYAARDMVGAYEVASAASIIGSDLLEPDASLDSSSSDRWGSCALALPAMARMSHGIAGRMKRISECLTMMRWMFDASSEVFGALNHVALAQTIVRHICLSLRMVVMAPQSVHMRSGCFLVLRKLSELEQVLNLGRLDLRNGHRYSQIIDKRIRKAAMTHSLPSNLPRPLVNTLSDNSTEDVDAEAEFRKSLSSPAVVVEKRPQRILQDLQNMCKYLYIALADDVYQNFRQDVKALVVPSNPFTENGLSEVAKVHGDLALYSRQDDFVSRDPSKTDINLEKRAQSSSSATTNVQQDDNILNSRSRPNTSQSGLSTLSDILDSGRVWKEAPPPEKKLELPPISSAEKTLSQQAAIDRQIAMNFRRERRRRAQPHPDFFDNEEDDDVATTKSSRTPTRPGGANVVNTMREKVSVLTTLRSLHPKSK